MKKDFSQLSVGVLGGGQLGRMMIQSAMNFALDVHVLDPDPQAPCSSLASSFTVGKLTDFETVLQFGRGKDVLTIEIENVNVEALFQLEKEGVKVYPQPRVIALIQDKRLQKQFYKEQGIPTAPFVLIDKKEELAQYSHWLPAIQKLGKEGYDGKGVKRLKSSADLESAFEKPSLLEELIDFEKEIAMIVARNEQGEVKCFPLVEMEFSPTQNLVEYLFSPAEVDEKVEQEARAISMRLIEQLDMVGLLAVEMFLTKDGKVLVNEMAPRTHNSGHQSIEGNYTSQFEQHIRAILNLPLGATDIVRPSAMINLLGEEGFEGPARYQGAQELLQMKGAYLHLYGKKTTKPHRKMGHITITADSVKELKEKALYVKELVKVKC